LLVPLLVAKILQKNIYFSYCCIVLHYHAWLPRFKKYCPAWGVKYAGIGLLYPFCLKKLKIVFLDFLGLLDATVFFCTSNFQTPCIQKTKKYSLEPSHFCSMSLRDSLLFLVVQISFQIWCWMWSFGNLKKCLFTKPSRTLV
jgi:hypothetical protein